MTALRVETLQRSGTAEVRARTIADPAARAELRPRDFLEALDR